jgi:hypothetical protein
MVGKQTEETKKKKSNTSQSDAMTIISNPKHNCKLQAHFISSNSQIPNDVAKRHVFVSEIPSSWKANRLP